MRLKVKIFIVGPFQAGKTTVVHMLDPHAHSVERKVVEGSRVISTTVGFDLGKVLWIHGCGRDEIVHPSRVEEQSIANSNCEVWEVTLMGSPGQMKFRAVREALSRGSDGVLFVIDSTKPGQVGYVISLLEEVRAFLGKDVPMVVLANKQDLEDALKADEIKRILKLENVKIVETSAIRGEGVVEGLLELLKMVREAKRRKIEARAAMGVR